MPVQTFFPSPLDQSVTNWAVAARMVGSFAPHAQATPNLTLALDAGHLLNGTTLTEVNAQSVGPFVPPSSNFRIDRVVVDRSTGAAAIVTGTVNSLTPPSIPVGKLPVAQVKLMPTSTTITNDLIVDERALADLTPPPSNVIICRATLGGVDQTGVATGNYTKIAFSTADFDIGNAFDAANNRFSPSVAGHYEVSAQVAVEIPASTYVGIAIRKNGGGYVANATASSSLPSTVHAFAQINDFVYLNGTTDYLDIWGAQFTGTSRVFIGRSDFTYFTAKRI